MYSCIEQATTLGWTSFLLKDFPAVSGDSCCETEGEGGDESRYFLNREDVTEKEERYTRLDRERGSKLQ